MSETTKQLEQIDDLISTLSSVRDKINALEGDYDLPLGPVLIFVEGACNALDESVDASIAEITDD